MSTYEKYFNEFERMFFANCAITVLVQSCIGGIATMAVLMNGTGLTQMLQLFVVVILSIGFNGTILSQQKPKVIYNAFLLALTVNIMLAVINFAR